MISTALHVCQILDAFTVETPSLRLSEVAVRVGLRPSSVFRLLRTLVHAGVLTFEPAGRRYRLGPQVGRLSHVYRASNSLAALARPALERVRDATGETVAMHVRRGESHVCLLNLESPHPIRMLIELDRPYPLAAGAAGHVLRAFSAGWEQQPDAQRLAAVRASGYAVSSGEIVPDSVAVCVPVLTPAQEAAAAIGVHGPAYRIAESRLPRFTEELRRAAEELSPILPG